MLFSKRCEYGIRAAVYIASQSDGESKIGIRDICDNIEAPQHFTAKILQILTKSNLICSKKGMNGGFYMTEAQLQNPLMNIVKALDGVEILTKCGLGLKVCSGKEPCPLHHKYESVRNSIINMFTDVTIKEMSRSLKKGNTVLKTY